MFLCLLSPSVSSVFVSAPLKLPWRKQKPRKVPQRKRGRKENCIQNTDPGRRWETKTQKGAVRIDPKKKTEMVRGRTETQREGGTENSRKIRDQNTLGLSLGSHSYGHRQGLLLDS